MTQAKREVWIDVLRGIGILLVVLGHTTAIPFWLLKFIYSFHLPLFFYLSGFLFNVKKYESVPFGPFMWGRFKRLIVPYFVMAFICLGYVVLRDLKHHALNAEAMMHFLWGIIYSRGNVGWMPLCSPLWFLTCLFITECMFMVITRLARGRVMFLLCVAVSGFIGAMLSLSHVPKMFWNIDTALTALVFFCGGNLVAASLRTSISVPRLVCFVVFACMNVFSVYLNPVDCVSFNGNYYGNILLMYIGAIGGIGMATISAKWIADNLKGLGTGVIVFWGVNTLPVIGLDYLTLGAINSFLGKIGLEQYYLLNFVLHLALLWGVIWVIRLNGSVQRVFYGQL